MRKGDLVHVPSNVLLLANDADTGDFVFTCQPEVGVFLGNDGISSGLYKEKHCKVFCMGKVWLINKSAAFEFVSRGERDVGKIDRSEMEDGDQ